MLVQQHEAIHDQSDHSVQRKQPTTKNRNYTIII